MKYDSLLLNCGGGIINDAKKSAQFTGSAALCIGIGGTGVAALSDLKGKIYQQLEPDNPGEPVPRYDAIQLLGIDSDDTAYKKYRGNCRLSENEFFTIKKENLHALIHDTKGKALIMGNRQMDWMEIEKITKLLSPEGAGGIRQMGRYLLMSRASALVTEIQKKCQLALEKRESNSLDIYIFAGISGGTGSGCFLDTCYLVRHVVESSGWNAKIMGYFFLPDVVTSKPEVAAKPAAKAFNNSNGYAAMKELDYLMSLKEANDWFEQSYGSGIKIRTQEPPVDMCHLISAQKADGTQVPNGFGYGINVASDYAMAYLAEVELNGSNAEESSLTMRGHLANVTRGVLGIPRRWGANLSYHILGASNAEIPMTQINTYLAVGFFKKFRKAAYKPRNTVTKSVVQKLMEQMHFQAHEVYAGVVSNSPALRLPEIDRTELARQPVCPRGRLPESWATIGNDWLANCDGEMVRNANGMTKKLESYDYEKINVQSLIGRLYRRLWELSVNPEYGPYYAAYLLSNNGNDLLAALDGEIAKADGREEAQRIQIIPMQDDLVEYNQELINKKGNKKSYAAFYDAAERYYQVNNAVIQCAKTAQVLRDLRAQVETLYTAFFKPLCEMLDSLQETFEENDAYLQTPEAKEVNAYTWQILSLDQIKPRLDEAVELLNETQIVNRFINNLLKNSDAWLKGDQDKIALLIREHMLELFHDESIRNLQDYLFDKFPQAKPSVTTLAQEIEGNILRKVNTSAVPMFWCDPTYDISDPGMTFESSSLSVPSDCAAVCTAADNFGESNPSYAVRKTGIGDRIFALRFISGIPLFAYHGITILKGAYDAAGGTAAGAGSHLYAKTGRGKDGSGSKDWRTYLPTPMPYSKIKDVDAGMHPDGAKLCALYREAVNRGVIGIVPKDGDDEINAEIPQEENAPDAAVKAENDTYAIFVTPEIQIKDYTVQDFMDKGVFSKAIYEKELQKIQEQSRTLHAYGVNEKCAMIELKNDGDNALCDPENVRMDYFVQYRVLHSIVSREIAKDKALKKAQEQIRAIAAEFSGYEEDLKSFTNLLFYRLLECRDRMDQINYKKTAFVFCSYKDKYDDEQKYYLCDGKMPFAEKYPLYQAFLSYRKMEEDGMKSVRADLDKQQENLAGVSAKLDDTYVAAILDQVWDAEEMEELRNVKLKGESEADQKAILRFYDGLRSNIKAYKDSMPVWPKGRKVDELTAEIAGGKTAGQNAAQTGAQADDKPAAPPVNFIYVWYNGEEMKIYPQTSMSYAWSERINDWVKLNPWMYVGKDGQWVPIQLDPYGNLIY